MRLILVLGVVMSLTSTPVLAGDLQYPASLIPDELKKGANAVVRENEMVFTILSANHARVHHLFAITILNPKGDIHASDVEYYDNLTKLTMFTASAYDASGKLIKKLKSAEFRDQSVFDGASLYNDDRLKYADLEQNTYPYTVVFEYEKEYKFLFFIDSFEVVPHEKVSTQKASYQLIFPTALTPRYKTLNIAATPVKGKGKEAGTETLLWEFTNIMPIKFEPMAYGELAALPRIVSAPSVFEYDGYKGDMTTWNDYGKWVSTLNAGRDVLPPETKAKIRALTAKAVTIEEKSRIVYEFVQNRSRYVGIQLGIGGFQPFAADVVDRTGYGDCKALSNYTLALLREVGVPANYVLILAGEENYTRFDPSFPSQQFNHATVCVPNGKDSLWLECTSQTAPFGYAGKFTGDRNAIAITETGAKVVHTTIYPAGVNTRTIRANVTIDAAGNATSKVATRFNGLMYEYDGLDFVLGKSHDDQKKWVEKYTNIPNFNLQEFSITNQKDKIPSAIVKEDLILNRLATTSGKRMFLMPNLMSRSTYVPESVENRTADVLINYGRTFLDTIEYNIPEALYAEFLPQPITITSQFGNYKADFKLEQGKLIYTRQVSFNKGKYPPGAYGELIEFYKKISKADATKVALLNKT